MYATKFLLMVVIVSWLSRTQYRSKLLISYSLSVLKFLYDMEPWGYLFYANVKSIKINKLAKICEHLDSNVFVHGTYVHEHFIILQVIPFFFFALRYGLALQLHIHKC